MKINAVETIKTLSGQVMKDQDNTDLTVGKILGTILGNDKSEGKMKLYTLATKLYQATGEVEVDASDMALIKSATKRSQLYGALIAGQVELALELAKE